MPLRLVGARLLSLDDERDMAESCRLILKSAGYECLATTDPMQAISLLESENSDLLIADLKMPTMDGMDVLRRSLEIDPLRPVIIFTAFASIESAIAAIKKGAFDYLAKPFSMDQLKIAVGRAMKQRTLALENFHLREQIHGTYGFDNIVGASPTLRRTLELVRKAALGSECPDHRRVGDWQRADCARDSCQQPALGASFDSDRLRGAGATTTRI
jgi:DNA-binding NtrC family response regulator